MAADLSDDRLATYLTYAHFHWRYFVKLITPCYLCYDYGYPCLPHILHLNDRRNAYPLMLYSFLAYMVYEGLARKRRHILLALALGLVPFLPAAHVLLPVGTPVVNDFPFSSTKTNREKSPASPGTHTNFHAILL